MDKQTLASGKFLRFVKCGGWEYIERNNVTGIVAILAITEAGKIILTEQFRRPVGKFVIELPAGLAGDIKGEEKEALEVAARRELLEETGYQAQKMICLTKGTTAPGAISEVVNLYKAEGLQRMAKGGGDATENIKVHEIPLNDATAWLQKKAADGALVDFKVYVGLYFASIKAA